MSNNNFDIESLLRFTPPRFFCKRCYALLKSSAEILGEKGTKCPICEVEYIPTEKYRAFQIGQYLTSEGLEIKYENLIGHCKKLANISSRTKKYLKYKKKILYSDPPLRALYQSLLIAQKFIHFSSYGISMMLFGALKVVAQKIEIRGIISNVKKDQIQELTKFKDEAPNLNLVIFERGSNRAKQISIPHQKFIIIDGLMAFKGSSNLTLDGWRKAAEGREIIELVTNVEQVIELNNDYFSPVWAESSHIVEITMEEEVPF